MIHSAKFQGAMTLALCGESKHEMIRNKDRITVVDRDVNCPDCKRKLALDRIEIKQRMKA